MAYKRILTIQDISCVGQCSMTVALPILSACGQECCVLPTAVLSTHTGGFGKPEVLHMTQAADRMWRHWEALGITFDAILVGYLGSVDAIEMVQQILDRLLSPGGLAIIDPAMADHGKLYSGFDEAYVAAMKKLCAKADILIPNLTEVALLAGMDFSNITEEDYVNEMVKKICAPCVVLTGAFQGVDTIGVLVKNSHSITRYIHRKVGTACHGTGDMFAACFTGALMRGKKLEEAVKIAADFTVLSIENTVNSPAHWYGVKFETAIPELIRMLKD